MPTSLAKPAVPAQDGRARLKELLDGAPPSTDDELKQLARQLLEEVEAKEEEAAATTTTKLVLQRRADFEAAVLQQTARYDAKRTYAQPPGG